MAQARVAIDVPGLAIDIPGGGSDDGQTVYIGNGKSGTYVYAPNVRIGAAPPGTSPTSGTNVLVVPLYEIGIGDTLKITQAGANQEPLTVVVQNDGQVMLPDIGDLTASGKTLLEVANDIQTRMRRDGVFVKVENYGGQGKWR